MRRSSAFTLVELLVATGIFLLIGVMLVGVLRSGLEVWHRGEARRDVYERGQVILDLIARDLAAAWVERDPPSTKGRAETWDKDSPPWDHAGLTCDRDALGRQRLVFTKRGRPDHGSGGEVEETSEAPPKQEKEGDDEKKGDDDTAPEDAAAPAAEGSDEAGQILTVVWVMDPEPGQFRLWRGTSVFGSASLTPKDLADPAFVHAQFALVATGVLDVEVRFWDADTRDWTAPLGSRNGPASRWDSTRAWDERAPGYLGLNRAKVDSPDILPERVMVSLTLLPEADREHGTQLSADVDSTVKTIGVDSTTGFPDAPGAALVGGEWFKYSARDAASFTVEERGARGTRAEAHKRGARVVSGEPLSTVVWLPCWKEPRKDEERR